MNVITAIKSNRKIRIGTILEVEEIIRPYKYMKFDIGDRAKVSSFEYNIEDIDLCPESLKANCLRLSNRCFLVEVDGDRISYAPCSYKFKIIDEEDVDEHN